MSDKVKQLKARIAALEAEVRRTTAIRGILEAAAQPIEEVFLNRDLVYKDSVLKKYVTSVDMPSRGTRINLAGGYALGLYATTQRDLDKMILFGDGVEKPLGIVQSSVSITIECDNFYNSITTENLFDMMDRALSLSTARWVVKNHLYYSDLKNMKDANGRPLIETPIIQLHSSSIPDNERFILGLFSLEYYILGEYCNSEGEIMIDGVPILQYPIDGEGYSPFVVLK